MTGLQLEELLVARGETVARHTASLLLQHNKLSINFSYRNRDTASLIRYPHPGSFAASASGTRIRFQVLMGKTRKKFVS
jgi:hypothetical protein